MALNIPSPIEDLIKARLFSFQDIGFAANEALYKHGKEVPLSAWRDEARRLRIWGLEVGAFDIGPTAVDHRIKTCKQPIRLELEALMSELGGVTQEIKTVLSHDPAEGPIVIEFSETLKDRSDNTIGIPEGNKGRTELQLLYGEILSIIQCLNKMTRMIPSNDSSETPDEIISDPSRSANIARDQADDSQQGVGQYLDLCIPTDQDAPFLADERGTKRPCDGNTPGIEELSARKRRTHRP